MRVSSSSWMSTASDSLEIGNEYLPKRDIYSIHSIGGQLLFGDDPGPNPEDVNGKCLTSLPDKCLKFDDPCKFSRW